MTSPLICLMSPLSRPVSKRTVRRKQLVMSGTKEGPHKLHTQPKESLVSSPTSDHVSDSSPRKSSGMEADALLASVVSSKKKQDSANNQNDDIPQGNDEVYHTSTVIKKKKSSPVKGISVASPRIQKQRKSMPFVSPGKRSLSRNRHGLDGIHQRRTVSMTIVDMKKLSEAIESRIGQQKKCGKVDIDTQPYEPDASFTTSDRDVSGLSSSKSPGIETNEFLADSSKNQEQHDHPKVTDDEINLQPAVLKRKTSSASKMVASRSPRVQKGRRSMSFVSPGQRSLSRSMHGLDGIYRRRAVSMTTMDMKKLCEAIESRVRKKKRNKNVDLDTQPHECEVSFMTSDHDVSDHLTNSSRSQEPVDFLQRIDEMYLKSDVKKRKNSCKTISVASRSPRVQKRRSCMPFVSPGKRSLSRTTNGLDEIHRRRTVSMTTVDMKKLQEFIDCSQIRKKENEKVDDQSQSPNTSLTVNDSDFSGSSSSPGVEVDVFLAGIVDKTEDSTQQLEHDDDDYRRSNDSFHKCEVTKQKIISSCKKISASARSPRIQKQRNSVSPGQRLLSRSMRGLDEIHRCRSLKKLDKKKLQQAIYLSHIRTKKTGEKVGQNPLHTIKSPSQKIKELVKTAVDETKRSDNVTSLKGRHSVPEPELRVQDKAVAPRPKEKEEDITHALGFAVKEKKGKTPDLNFKKLDEMYESRFNPSQKCPQAVVTSRGQECTQADLDFEKLDEMYERWFNPSPECTDEAVVDMDTVTRILSFQDEQTDSRSSSPPIIQRRAFAGDIIDPESDDISDSTVDEANKTLLEKEISSFFESKKGYSPKDFRKGAKTLDVAVNRVSEGEPVTSTGATLQSQNVSEHDDVMVIDQKTHYRIPDSIQEMEGQATSPKCAPLASRDHAMASTRYNFGESMPIDVEMDGQQDDICTPFQHSTPADHTHLPQSHTKTTSQDLLSAWAEIEKEEKLFVMYCHEDTAPCILKDLEGCPAIIDSRSLSLRYLNDTLSVEVQGMVLKDEHITKPKKIPKENRKDAAKKEKKKKRKKVLTVTGADGKKNEAPKRKKKSGTMKEMKKQKDTKVETKEARKEGTEMNMEGKIETEKELKKTMKKRTKREAKKQTKREKKEPKGETEKETKKPTKKKTHTDKKNVPESEIKNEMRKEATKEVKKPMKKKRKTDREEPKSEQETETKKPTKKKTKVDRKEPKSEQETETIEPTKKKTKTEKRKELEKEMKNKAGEQTKTGAEKETQKKTKVDKKKEPKIKMQKTTKNEAMKETEKEAVNVIEKEMKERLREETTKKKRIRVNTDIPKEMTKEVIKKKKEETIKEKQKVMKEEVKKETKEKRKKGTKKGTTEGTKKKDKKKEISKGRKEGTQKETKKKTKKDTMKRTKEGMEMNTKNEAKKETREGTKKETRKNTTNEKRKVKHPDGSVR